MTQDAQDRFEITPSYMGLDEIVISPPLESAPDDALRPFTACIWNFEGPERCQIGHMSGWIGWSAGWTELFELGDRYSGDAAHLCFVVDQIVESLDEVIDVVLLDHIEIDSRYRGNRLLRRLLNDLCVTLRLDETATLVAAIVEPLEAATGRLDTGPTRDQALVRLQRAYAHAGFKPWQPPEEAVPSDVWWRLSAD